MEGVPVRRKTYSSRGQKATGRPFGRPCWALPGVTACRRRRSDVLRQQVNLTSCDQLHLMGCNGQFFKLRVPAVYGWQQEQEMRCIRYIFLSCAFVALATTQSGAADGTLLYKSCMDKSPYSALGLACEAYIRGFQDGMGAGSTVGSRISCLPQQNMVVQDRLIIEKFLREHPEKLHLEAGLLVFEALVQAFPCLKR
jgi:Rap1a immunity proteins